jgi:hypothetical protein
VSASGQRHRHSPGKTQRKIMRGTNEIELSSNWGVRQRSCFLPCANGLHALCHSGALTEMLAMWMARSMFEQMRLVDKSCATGGLLGILFCGADGNPSRNRLREIAYCVASDTESGRVSS